MTMTMIHPQSNYNYNDNYNHIYSLITITVTITMHSQAKDNLTRLITKIGNVMTQLSSNTLADL
jgi:hypothetical protein